jgi:biotin transport system substrate-specific component
MSAATISGPLVTLALPQDRSARLVAQTLLVIGGTILLAVAAKVSVPFWPVPMTLQTLAVFVISAAYGRNLAVATMLAYLAEGAIGLPVFATGAGLAYMAGPTGGYLVGFVVAAAIVGHAADRGLDRNAFLLFGAMMLGEVVILALGAAWLAVLMGGEKALALGIGPFIVTDIVKIALATAIVRAAVSMTAQRQQG